MLFVRIYLTNNTHNTGTIYIYMNAGLHLTHKLREEI